MATLCYDGMERMVRFHEGGGDDDEGRVDARQKVF